MALTVSSFMTNSPHTVHHEQPLSAAERMMSAHAIRHLPVLDNLRVVGLLSAREVELVSAFVGGRTDRIRIRDVMIADPFVVTPDALLDEVALVMAEKRYGSAVIVDGGRPVGVFTAVDALRALARLADSGTGA